MKRISAKESEHRWVFLLNRNNVAVPEESSTSAENADPFDCSKLAVPPTTTLVDENLGEFIEQWKNLDERKVPPEVASTNKRKASARSEESNAVTSESAGGVNQNSDQERPLAKAHRLPNWGWHANRLRMPDKFDYATRRPSPPPDDAGGARVVSLTNPLLHVSYEQELWKLFRSVPTATDMEQDTLEGAACHQSRQLHKEMTEALAENTRLDGHALSRMRHRDRHGLPPTLEKQQPLITTVRFECWRRRLRRGSSPDSHRMELEFRASQTLADVHTAIVELSQDDLWNSAQNGVESEVDSGLFFIHDTFYTNGSVDYVAPIVEWLAGIPATQDGTEDKKLSRRYYLGISPQGPLNIKTMSEARLNQLSLSLGVRYHHVHHGDVECSVFVTDVRLAPERSTVSYPIVHDVWTPSYSMVDCEACQRLVSALVTPTGDAMTHGSPTALCQSCFRQLYAATDHARPTTQPYNVFREQTDISTGHDSAKALF